jgi:predicted nucleic acid-binding protein
MKFWDSSAVIPLCLIERQSKVVKKVAMEDEAIVAWWGTPVECFSALARLRRDEALSEIEEEQARTILRTLQGAWAEVEPTNVVREQAGRVVRLHPLRAADAVQLAAALVWCQGDPSQHGFVCLDQRLRDAARREGFIVFPKM